MPLGDDYVVHTQVTEKHTYNGNAYMAVINYGKMDLGFGKCVYKHIVFLLTIPILWHIFPQNCVNDWNKEVVFKKPILVY